MSAQTDKERVIAELLKAHYQQRIALAHHAYDAGYAAALERAAQVADELRAPNDNLGDYNLACSRVAAAIRALKEKAAGTTEEGN